MLVSYPSTALRASQAEVKQAAQEQKVIITDNGGRIYYFLTEESYDDALLRAAEGAAYAERMSCSIRRARAGIARGECVEGADAAIAAVRELRAGRG